MSLSRAAPIILSLCDAISYMHQRGIVHCDLNASNVILDQRGQPKLVDLGIAHVSDDFVHRAWQTQRSFAMGTILCMAPEQLDGARGDPRVDLYALATLFYQLLAGRPYLDFDTRQTPSAQAENVRRVRSEVPRPISDLPPAVMAVLLAALAKDPDDRYPDVEAFRRELTQVLLAHLPSQTGIGLLTPAKAGHEAHGHAQSKIQATSTQPFEWPPWIWGVLVAINVVVMVLVGFLLIV
jgi:serine/threonine-protein kinase